MGCLNPKELQSCFINWTAAPNPATQWQVVVIDEKRMRGLYDNNKGQSAIYIVIAFAAENSVVLG